MATEGQLSDTSVEALLLDLDERRFTGVLKIKAVLGEGQVEALKIELSEGEIVQVDSPTRADAWRLGQLLVRGELVSAADVDEALERSKLRGKPLGVVLLGLNKLHQGQLEDILHMQFVEDLHRALGWKKGQWQLEAKEIPLLPGGPEPLDAEQVIKEGLKQAERWPTIRALVPSLDMSFVKRISGQIQPEEARQKKIGPQELKVFSLIHYSRSVRDLVPLARLETFEVCRSLALLIHGEIIAPHKEAEPEPVAAQPPSKAASGEKIREAAAFHGFTAFLVIAVLAAGLWIFLSAREKSTQEGQPEGGAQAAAVVDPMRDALTRGQIGRISAALEVYRRQRGDYPPRLEVLVEVRLLSEGDLKAPDYEGIYKYRPTGETYRLSRPKK